MIHRFFYMFVFWVVWALFFPMSWEEFITGYLCSSLLVLLVLSSIEYSAVIKDHHVEYKHKKIKTYFNVLYSNWLLVNLDLNATVYGLIVRTLCVLRDHTENEQFSEALQANIDKIIESLCEQGFEFEKHYYRVRPLWLKSASEEIKNDPDFMLEMISRSSNASNFLSEELKNSASFMLKAVEVNDESIMGAGNELKRDYKFFLNAYDLLSKIKPQINKEKLFAEATPHTQKELEAAFYIRQCGEEISEKVHILQQQHLLELKREGISLGGN